MTQQDDNKSEKDLTADEQIRKAANDFFNPKVEFLKPLPESVPAAPKNKDLTAEDMESIESIGDVFKKEEAAPKAPAAKEVPPAASAKPYLEFDPPKKSEAVVTETKKEETPAFKIPDALRSQPETDSKKVQEKSPPQIFSAAALKEIAPKVDQEESDKQFSFRKVELADPSAPLARISRKKQGSRSGIILSGQPVDIKGMDNIADNFRIDGSATAIIPLADLATNDRAETRITRTSSGTIQLNLSDTDKGTVSFDKNEEGETVIRYQLGKFDRKIICSANCKVDIGLTTQKGGPLNSIIKDVGTTIVDKHNSTQTQSSHNEDAAILPPLPTPTLTTFNPIRNSGHTI